MRCEPVNTSRLRTIFAARSAFLEDLFQFARTGLAAGVMSISSSRCPITPCSGLFISCAMPGDELPERRELFGLRQPLAQRRALRLEPRLPRDVARDEHAPERVAVLAWSAASPSAGTSRRAPRRPRAAAPPARCPARCRPPRT